MSSSSLIRAENLHFGYGDTVVFKNFSLDIKPGEKLAIKGESGTGKTTLFRLLLGFETPDAGSIYYHDAPYTTKTIKQLRRELAWLPQDLNLGEGSVYELIHFLFDFQANKNLHPDKEEILQVLKTLGLARQNLQQQFSDLSTGQRQRVGLACCHLLKRDFLVLDEPTSALDRRSKQKVADLLLNDGYTVLSTSHDDWWLERCDRIIELKPQPQPS